MAEQNNEKQTINFAGREIDRKEFGRRVLAKLGAWMDYQGLRGEERTDFIQAINDKMNGLFDGTLTSSEFGVIEGGAPNQENQYKQNGSRSEGFSLSRRHGFNPGENADIFLNGIAGTMDEGASTSGRSSKKATTWDKSLSTKLVMDSIFGEGNEGTAAQLKLWADKFDPVNNGVRSTEGRKKHIIELLDNYIGRLNSGEFDLSDEDREAEIKRIGDLKNALYNNDSFELGKLAPWASNLLFTDEEYYATPEAKQTAEQQNLAKQAEEYIKNGGENPYNKESNPDEWQATEDARKARLDLNFANEFEHYSTRSTQLRGEHWLHKYNDVSNPDVFRGWEWNGQYGVPYLLDALYLVNEDISSDGSGYDMHTGLFGIGGTKFGGNNILGWQPKAESQDGVDLSREIPNLYMETYDEPNDDFGSTSAAHAGRSANSYRGQYLSDYLNYVINSNGNKYRIASDSPSFILPDMVDWSKGTAYLITQGMNLKGSIRQINIADYLTKIKDKNPDLYQELLQSYARYKGHKILSSKNGGILKAQFGDVLNTSNAQTVEDIENQKAEISAMGLEEFNRRNLENSELHWTTSDKMRIGAIAADVVSTVSAFAPGYGTAVAAVTGIGSTGTNLIADMTDPTVSSGQVWGNLATNAGLDIASLIPGLNVGAGTAKVAKNIVKYAPKIMAGLALVENGGGAVAAVKKLVEGKDLTTGDWKNLAYGMSALAGTSRIAANSYRVKHNKNYAAPQATKNGKVSVSYNESGVMKQAEISKADFDAINSQKTLEGALKLFRLKIAAATKANPDDIQFSGKETFGKKLGILNKPLKGEELMDSPDLLAFRQHAARESAKLRESGRTLGISNKWLGQRLGLKNNYEMLGIIPTTQKAEWFSSPFARGFKHNQSDTWKATKSEYDAITQAQKDFGNGVKGTPTAEQQAQLDAINTQRTNVQKSIKDNERTLTIAKNSKGRLEDYTRRVRVNEHRHQVEDRINQVTKSLQTTKDPWLLKALNKELATLQRRLANLKAIKKLASDKQVKNIENVVKLMRTAKTNETKARQAADNGRKQLTEINKQQTEIDNQLLWATYNRYRDLVRQIYGLKKGGIIKASLGTLIPPEAEKKQTPQLASSNTGTVGEPVSNTGTTEASTNTGSVGNPNTGSVGGSNTGSVGETGKPAPSSTTYNAYDNGFMPEEHSSIYPSDIILTLLQLEGNDTAHRYNYDMTQQQLAKIPYHKTPMIYGYKVHTSKPIEDLIAQTRAIYNQMGANAARGTADQGAAFAYKLTAANKASEATNPLTLKQSEFVLNSEDKAREAAYKTAESYHDVGDFNHEQDVKDYNDERDIWTQYLSQEGKIKMKDIALRQRGLAATSEQNYRRSVLARQAEYTYRRLSEKKAAHPEDWTDDDEQQLEKAYRTWTQINTPAPMNMPYAGFSNYYTAQRPLSNFSYWNN